VREGPNVRRSFDAVRVLTRCGGWQLDALYGRPVETDGGVFDDGGEDGVRFWGVYATLPLGGDGAPRADLYYLGLDHEAAAFAQGAGEEVRHSMGVRLSAGAAALDYDLEGVYQWGRFGTGDIRAWTVASDVGWSPAAAPLRPRLALRADASSGDPDPADADLGTFHPLFPRGNYFGESAILGPLNLLDLHPILQLRPADALAMEVGWGWFWRFSARDGVYGNGPHLIQPPSGSTARRIGSELSVLLEWQVHRHVSLKASYAHLFAGPFLEQTGPGRDVDYVTVAATWKF
jgi:hypothetical protein